MTDEEKELQEQEVERTPGWIRLYRQILESNFWLEDEPYDIRSAFIYVLVSANWKPKTFHARNSQMITINRGQLFTSTRSLAKQFNRSTKWVQNWYRRMIDHGMLTVQPFTTGTLLTVVNYSKFQDVGYTEETLSNTQRKHRVTRTGNTEGIRHNKNKECIEGEEGKKETALAEPMTTGSEEDEDGIIWYDDPEEAMRNAIV